MKFIKVLGLDRITLVGCDGGAHYGLCAAMERPERFRRLVIMNTDLPTGDRPLNPLFSVFKQFDEIEPDLLVGHIIRSAIAYSNKLSDDIIAAYEAPFPDASSKAGAAGAADMFRTRKALAQWQKPALVLFSEEDPLYGGLHGFFRADPVGQAGTGDHHPEGRTYSSGGEGRGGRGISWTSLPGHRDKVQPGTRAVRSKNTEEAAP